MKNIVMLSCFTLGLIDVSCTSCNHSNANPVAGVKTHFISDSTMAMLKIEPATTRNLEEEVKLSGTVSFDENKVVKVFAFSSGQVVSVNAGVGDFVKQGQPLAVIRSADIAGNYSDLSVAGNDVAISKRTMDNAGQLYQNGIASEKEYIEAKENYLKAVANRNKIEKQIHINGGGHTTASGSYIITAPRSGFIVERLINPGNFIRNDNNTNLFTIGDISDVWIWANVYETDVAKVKEGYQALVTTIAYPDSVFIGKVDKLNQLLDPTTKVMKVKIILPNKNNVLKPEMFANITIHNEHSKKQLAIPSSSVITDNGKNYVIIFNNQDDVKLREIEISKINGAYTFIKNGVAEGEKLITENQLLVYRKLVEK